MSVPGLARAWVRLLLRALPADFRSRFAGEMEATFAERWTEAAASGRWNGARLLLRTTSDLIAAALRERLDPTFQIPRGGRGHAAMDALFQDLRFAVRSLLRRPGFAAVAVFTLAIGIGANTAIFSVVNGVLLRPLPWPDQDRLVAVFAASETSPDARGAISRPDLLDVQATDAFEHVVGYSSSSDALTGDGEAEAIAVARVTSGPLAVFGLSPHLGRDLTLADTEEGAHEVVVLSHDFWVDRMGADAAAVGRTIELVGRPHRVVGVAPPGFAYPAGTQIWRPFLYDPIGCARGCNTYGAVGRLAEGVSLDRAREETDALAARLQDEHVQTNLGKIFPIYTLEEQTVGAVREGLWILLGAVGFVLLIACANVANLLLARAQTRTGEVAVRSALGAGAGRLASQVLVECLVLAAAGGALGLAVAYGGVGLIRRVATGTIPRIDEVGVDGTVLVFTLAVTALVGLLFGVGPALRVARAAPSRGLGAGSRRTSTSRADARSRSLLLVSEVALSLVLLTGAGLLLKSFARLYAIDPGYETESMLRFSLTLPEANYPDLPSVAAFYRTLEERLAAEPEVEAVGSTFGPPLGRGSMSGGVEVEGRPEPPPGEGTSASIKPVTPGYLATMRVPVLRGRGIEPADAGGAVPVALVNETFARENFPEEEVLGQRVRMTASFFDSVDPTWTIVGVVPDLKTRSLTGEAEAEIFVPHAQFGPAFMTVTLRLAPGGGAILPAVRDAVRSLDPNVPVRAVETIEEAVGRQTASTRFFLTLVGLFSALGVLLAGTGLYGVAAFLASGRRREMGIRVALGAPRGEIVRLMLGSGLRPALYGVALGLVGAWTATRWLEQLLYEVEAHDPLVYAGVSVLLIGVVVLSSLLPAREAARVDPVEALRAE